MAVLLPNLPYARDSLQPHLSAAAVSHHYDAHHQDCIDELNGLIAGSAYDALALDQIIDRASMRRDEPVLTSALRAWHHGLYWQSLSPSGGGRPGGRLMELISLQFRSFERFMETIRKAASLNNDNGWVWLVVDRGLLRITTSRETQSPIRVGQHPILALDLWAHAYFLDYGHDRDRYIDALMNHLINWDFASVNLDAAEMPLAA